MRLERRAHAVVAVAGAVGARIFRTAPDDALVELTDSAAVASAGQWRGRS